MSECVPCKAKAQRNEAKLNIVKERAITYAKENLLNEIIIYECADEETTTYTFRQCEGCREIMRLPFFY
jgi:hypothetical protein